MGLGWAWSLKLEAWGLGLELPYPHPLALTTGAGRRAVVSFVPASILTAILTTILTAVLTPRPSPRVLATAPREYRRCTSSSHRAVVVSPRSPPSPLRPRVPSCMRVRRRRAARVRGRTSRPARACVEASDLEKHIVTSTTKASEMSAGCTWPGRAKDNNDLNSCKTATAARRDSRLPTFLLRRSPFFQSGLCACKNVRTKTTCSLHLAGPPRSRPGRRRRSTNDAEPPGYSWCSGGLPVPAAGAGAPSPASSPCPGHRPR